MNSSVLVIGQNNEAIRALGFDSKSSWSELSDADFTHRKILAFQITTEEKNLIEKLERFRKESPGLQSVILGGVTKLKSVALISQTLPVFSVHNNVSSDELPSVLQTALEHQESNKQSSELLRLKEVHHENLRNMSNELKEVIDKKEKNLERAKKRISTINKQVSGLHKALVAVHKANSVGEVEVLLTSELKSEVNLAIVRVYFENQSHLESQLERAKEFTIYKAPLILGDTQLGKIIFGRMGAPFTKNEQAFLSQVSEGVSLAIDRLTKLEQAEHLKREWESTFDAISDPLCLTTANFNIIRTNKAFSKVSRISLRELIGLNCFRAFLGDTQFPGQMIQNHLRIEKSVDGEMNSFEVTAQKIQTKDSESAILLMLFRNITEQQRIEKQIFESAKMAELGTVGSSIAHELNNPLGGLMSFLQLIKMDLKKEDLLNEDIDDMLAAAHRCKDIIENLLGFTRRQDTTTDSIVDFRDSVNQALKLIDLKTRSSSIEVNVSLPTHEVKLKLQANLIAQALNHILQNSLDAIEEKLTQTGRFKGRIDVEMWQDNISTYLKIKDNGVGIDFETQKKVMNPLFTTKGKRYSGLGLTLAYKIIDDHKGQLEISSQPSQGTEVKISLSNV